jgi:hypothetical protein
MEKRYKRMYIYKKGHNRGKGSFKALEAKFFFGKIN